MGLGGISIWQLVIILVIVLLIFGTKRLKGLGGDLGGAIKGFKEAVSNDEDPSDAEEVDGKPTDEGAQTSQSKEQSAKKTSNDGAA